MKKRIILLLLIILMTTGCTCEYNLTIENDDYHEEVILNGTTQSEIASFKQDWKIPTDKEEYNIGGDIETTVEENNSIYDAQVSGSKLILKHNFTKSSIVSSSAISNCYDRVSIVNYENQIIISSDSQTTCFAKYNNLTTVSINIKVDKPVISHNANSVNGNTYTWIITKKSPNKAINIVLNNENNNNPNNSGNSSSTNNKEDKNNSKYTLYIFALILLIVIYFGYKIAKEYMEKNKTTDD